MLAAAVAPDGAAAVAPADAVAAAIASGDAAALTHLEKTGALVPANVFAIVAGHARALDWLLRQSPRDFYLCWKTGRDARVLVLAQLVERGRIESLTKLIEYGWTSTDIFCNCEDVRSVTRTAAHCGQLDVFKLYHNWCDEDFTLAVVHDHVHIVRWMLKSMRPFRRQRLRREHLWIARREPQSSPARALVCLAEFGFVSFDDSLLSCILSRGFVSCLDTLLERRLAVRRQCDCGRGETIAMRSSPVQHWSSHLVSRSVESIDWFYSRGLCLCGAVEHCWTAGRVPYSCPCHNVQPLTAAAKWLVKRGCCWLIVSCRRTEAPCAVFAAVLLRAKMATLILCSRRHKLWLPPELWGLIDAELTE